MGIKYDVEALTTAMGKPDHPFKPNWREAFEQVLARGGKPTGFSTCKFCVILGVNVFTCPNKCNECPLFAVSPGDESGIPCKHIFEKSMDNSERRVICRYVLEHIGMTVDRDQARNLIAQALKILGKDDAREKFLGKAEPVKEFYAQNFCEGYEYKPHAGLYELPLKYGIVNKVGYVLMAFAYETARDRVLEFLNA